MPDRLSQDTLYLDESGSQDSRDVFLAGYLFTRKSLYRFMPAWGKLMKKYGDIPYFHMHPCVNRKKHFTEWSRDRCDLLQYDAIDMIQKYATQGFVVSYEKGALQVMLEYTKECGAHTMRRYGINDEEDRRIAKTEYASLGLRMISAASEWARGDQSAQWNRIALEFEQGSDGSLGVVSSFRKMRETYKSFSTIEKETAIRILAQHGEPPEIIHRALENPDDVYAPINLKSIIFSEKEDAGPLQCADMLARASNRHTEHKTKGCKPWEKHERLMQACPVAYFEHTKEEVETHIVLRRFYDRVLPGIINEGIVS